MMLLTSLFLAARQIRRHAMRSFLTVLGVVIGTFSVVVMVTLGDGATASVRSSISALGSDVLQIFPGQGRGRAAGARSAAPFKMADVAAIRSQIGGVTAVAGQAQTSGLAVRNALSWSTSVTGTTADYFRAVKLTLAEGRLFSAFEEEAGRRVCVVGRTVAKNLFADVSPLGSSIRIRGVSCDVVGVLAARGQSGFGSDQDDVVMMPLKAVQRQMLGSPDIQGIAVGVDPAYDGAAVRAAIEALLRERRAVGAGEDDDFSVLDARQISDTIAGTVRVLTLLVGCVAGVSLLVGGVGIMNIMLVSVTERTREIGVRLAIGARGEEVLTQFLVEAIALSCLGGGVGLVLALVVSALAAPLIGVPFLFNPGVNLLAFGFAAAIGVAFGYFPARRAAALDPIEALRYD